MLIFFMPSISNKSRLVIGNRHENKKNKRIGLFLDVHPLLQLRFISTTILFCC